MRVVIAGSRSIESLDIVREAIEESGMRISVVLSGGARGVDSLAEKWAIESDIPVELYKPDWKRYGRGAGLRRNIQMLENAEALIAVWDGRSKGTAHTIRQAEKRGLKVYVKRAC